MERGETEGSGEVLSTPSAPSDPGYSEDSCLSLHINAENEGPRGLYESFGLRPEKISDD
jgi:hypothetical protein